MDERAGEGGALHLAAGELVGSVKAAVGQADGFKKVPGSVFAQRVRPAREQEGKKDIFFHGEGGEEVEELEDEADLELAQAGEGVVVHGVEREAVDVHLAGAGGVEGAEDVKEGAFATAAGSGDSDDLPGENFQANAPEGIHLGIAGLVGFMEIAGFEHKKAGLRDM